MVWRRMLTVEIRLSQLADLRGFETLKILQRLREAGIPVKGLFRFQGLESGKLYEYVSPDGLGLIYDWVPCSR